MEKFLIEIPHEETESECINAVRIFHQTGSHFLARAQWGCDDGEHKAWLLVDVENKDQARQIIPSAFRQKAKIVRLKNFTRIEMVALAQIHGI
jgi:hypothetical protein